MVRVRVDVPPPHGSLQAPASLQSEITQSTGSCVGLGVGLGVGASVGEAVGVDVGRGVGAYYKQSLRIVYASGDFEVFPVSEVSSIFPIGAQL